MNTFLYSILDSLTDMGRVALKNKGNDDAKREPLLASGADIGKNMYKMWNFGFSGEISKPAGWDFAHNKWSVGGMTSGLARFGIGAALGAAAGSMTASPYGTAAGAAIGGAATWAAPAALGLAARGTLGLAGIVGNAEFNLGKNILFGAGGEAEGAGLGSAIGSAGFTAAAGATALIAHNPIINGLLNPEKLVKYNSEAEGFSKLKLSGLGTAYVGLGVAAGAIKNAWQAEKEIKMGQVDPYITRATPQIPSYMNNAGATGDLVFAMHKNRRG